MPDYKVQIKVGIDGAGAVRTEIVGIGAAAEDMARDVRTAGRRGAAGLDDITAESRRAREELDRLGRQAKTAAGLLAGAFAIDRIGDGLGGFVRTAADFEQALIGVQKTTDLTREELLRFGRDVRREAKDTLPVAAAEIAAIAEAAGTMGVTGRDNLLAYADAIAKLGASSDLKGGGAASVLGRLQRLTGQDPSKIAALASGIVALGNAFAATESEIAENASQIAQNLAQFGSVTAEQVIALGAVTRELGQQAEIAGSALGRLSRALITPDGAMAAFMGETQSGLQELARGDLVGTILSFFDRLAREGDDAAQALDALNLKGEELARTLPTLATNAQRVREALTAARDTEALEKEFALFRESLNTQTRLLRNAFTDIGLEIGEGLTPVLTDAVKQLRSVLADTEAVLSGIGTAATVVSGVLAARGVRAGGARAGEGIGALRRQRADRDAAAAELARVRRDRDAAAAEAERSRDAVRRAQRPFTEAERMQRAHDLARARAGGTATRDDITQALRDQTEIANRNLQANQYTAESWAIARQRGAILGQTDRQSIGEGQRTAMSAVAGGARAAPQELVDDAVRRRDELAALEQRVADQDSRLRDLRRTTGLRGAARRAVSEVSDFLGGPIGVGVTAAILAYKALANTVDAAAEATRALADAEEAYRQSAASTARSVQDLAALYQGMSDAQRSFETDRLAKRAREEQEGIAKTTEALRQQLRDLAEITVATRLRDLPATAARRERRRTEDLVDDLVGGLRDLDAAAPDAAARLAQVKDEIAETARQTGVAEETVVDFGAAFATSAENLLGVQQRFDETRAAMDALAQSATAARQAVSDLASAAPPAAPTPAPAPRVEIQPGTGLPAVVQHAGGWAGEGPTRRVDPRLFAGARRYHAGGPVLGPREVPAILERGEYVVPRGGLARMDGTLAAMFRTARAEADAYTATLGEVEAGTGRVAAAHTRTAVTATESFGQMDASGRAAFQSLAEVAAGFFGGAIEGLRRYADSTGDAVRNMEGIVSGAMRRLENELVHTFQTGEFRAREMIDAIVADFARLTIRQGITAPLAGAVSTALAGIFHDGGVAGATPSAMRLVPADLFAGARRDHAGSMPFLGPGEVPAILERGELVLSRAQTAAAMAPRAAAPTYQVFVDARGADDPDEVVARVDRAVTAAMQRQIPGIVRAAAEVARAKVIDEWHRRGGRF